MEGCVPFCRTAAWDFLHRREASAKGDTLSNTAALVNQPVHISITIKPTNEMQTQNQFFFTRGSGRVKGICIFIRHTGYLIIYSIVQYFPELIQGVQEQFYGL